MGDIMFEILFGVLIIVLCVMGAVSIIKACALSIAASKESKSRAYVCLLRGDTADIELQLALQTLEWDSALTGVRAFAVDVGLEDEMAIYCKSLCEGTRLKFISGEDARRFVEILGLEN